MKTKLIALLILLAGLQSMYAQNNYSTATRFMVKNPNQIFLGAILNSKSLNESAHQFVDARYNPIMLSYTFSAKSKEITPSRTAMLEAIRESTQASGTLKENYAFTYSVKELAKYSDLSVYFGQEVDNSFYFGVPAARLTSKTLVAVDISQSYFRVSMDMPDALCSNPDELEGYDKNELIFVSSIDFGRRVLLLVESDFDFSLVKAAVEYILNKAGNPTIPTDAKHETVFANSTLRTLVIGNEDIGNSTPDNPLEALVKYLNRKVSPENFGIPVAFTASRLKDNGEFENKFLVQ